MRTFFILITSSNNSIMSKTKVYVGKSISITGVNFVSTSRRSYKRKFSTFIISIWLSNGCSRGWQYLIYSSHLVNVLTWRRRQYWKSSAAQPVEESLFTYCRYLLQLFLSNIYHSFPRFMTSFRIIFTPNFICVIRFWRVRYYLLLFSLCLKITFVHWQSVLFLFLNVFSCQ